MLPELGNKKAKKVPSQNSCLQGSEIQGLGRRGLVPQLDTLRVESALDLPQTGKEQALEVGGEISFQNFNSGRIHTSAIEDFKISISRQPTQATALCPLKLEARRTDTMPAFGSETCPTLEGSTAEVLGILGSNEAGWQKDLLMAAQPTSCLTEEFDNQNVLNTPTMETPPFFTAGTAAVIGYHEEPASTSGETILAEYTVGTTPSTDMDDIFEEAWGNLGSPGDDLLTGVCPMEVEGKASFPLYTTTADSGGCVEEIQVTSVTEQGLTDRTSLEHTPVVLTGEINIDNTFPGEDARAKEETPSDDLLGWIVNDTIDPIHSAIPGEVKVEDNIPTTVNQMELNQLFSSYPTEEIGMNYLSEPSTAGPARSTADSRRRSRNISVASTSSSVDAPRRGRGRPPLPPGRAITPAVVRGRIVSGGEESDHFLSDGNLTDAEISDLRYRRMRDLNNEASKRCRENRKIKYQQLEDEAEKLKEKNLQLKARLQKIETAVMKAKHYYITYIVPGAGSQMPDISQLWASTTV